MTDDLVTRLRDPRYDGQLMMRAKAADRIERLEHQSRVYRQASFDYVDKVTEAEERILELEDALKRIAKANNVRDRYSPVIDAIVIYALEGP
jgi:hypothetical protein